MKHLTSDKLYHLAVLVTQELAYEESDVSDMTHIGQCDECYKKLRLAMALMDAVDHIGPISLAAKRKTAAAEQRISAVIHLIVGKARSLLEQFDAYSGRWTFDAPLAMAGARSGEDESLIQKLEDVENEQTFVAYDPAARLLALQIDCGDNSHVPSVVVRSSDGTGHPVRFRRQGQLLWGEVSNLDDGEYDIIIEK